jgi:hypothetical protein
MEEGHPATFLVWLECGSCGRIEKRAHEFTYPADLGEGMQLFVWQSCDQCGRQAKLHMRREVKPAR